MFVIAEAPVNATQYVVLADKLEVTPVSEIVPLEPVAFKVPGSGVGAPPVKNWKAVAQVPEVGVRFAFVVATVALVNAILMVPGTPPAAEVLNASHNWPAPEASILVSISHMLVIVPRASTFDPADNVATTKTSANNRTMNLLFILRMIFIIDN